MNVDRYLFWRFSVRNPPVFRLWEKRNSHSSGFSRGVLINFLIGWIDRVTGSPGSVRVCNHGKSGVRGGLTSGRWRGMGDDDERVKAWTYVCVCVYIYKSLGKRVLIVYSPDACLQQKSLQRRMATPRTTRTPTTPTMMPTITPTSLKGLQEFKIGKCPLNKI